MNRIPIITTHVGSHQNALNPSRRPARALLLAPVALCAVASGLAVLLLFAGCDKVESLKQAIADKTAKGAKSTEPSAPQTDNDPASGSAPAPGYAPRPESAGSKNAGSKNAGSKNAGSESAGADKPAGGDYDAELLKQVAAIGACPRVRAKDCEVYATLEKGCKAAWDASDKSPEAYARRWRTLLHGATTAKHRNARYGAVYLAHFKCRPTVALRSDEVQGEKLLAALKREGKEGYTATRMAELLASWWRADLPALHADMEELLADKSHPVPAARKELARLGGFYASKLPNLAKTLIAVALAEGDDMNVRRAAAGHLWRIAKGERQAAEAVDALVTLAAGPPSQLTGTAYAGLGNAAATAHWPALVARWRKDKEEAVVGGAMAEATWRYAIAKYPSDEIGVPQRIAAFDVAKEVLAEKAISASGRTWALYALQQGGHPGAEAALKKVAKGSDTALAKEAKDVLTRLKPVDPVLAAGLKGGRGKRAKRPKTRSASKKTRPTRRAVPRPRVTRPGR